MDAWKKTYVIAALCAIAAGLIYLSLPLSKEKDHEWQTKQEISIDSAELSGNILYRINENSVETSQGIYIINEETQWLAAGQEISKGKGRFLGQSVNIVQDQSGTVQKIETIQDLAVPQRIRVVLSADILADRYIHTKVAVTSEEAFWSVKDGAVQAHPPGAEIGTEAFGHRTIFFPSKEGSALTLISPKGTTAYLGQLEITAEEGGYSVVNEVALENYIKGVVPSEMPGSYGEEAAKVQAVCARSYVYCQWAGSDKFTVWGAQVDDSTKSQVYGGRVIHEACEKGVETTWGQFLTYNGDPVSTNYFSTSCGYTANGNEVWGGSEEAYQQGQPQFAEGYYGDLSQEEAFHAFITDYDVKAYDSQSPWFRWSLDLTMENLQKAASEYLAASPIVKTVTENALVEERINDLGTLTDIFVYERSQTGMAQSILLVGTESTIVIEKPMEIRKLFGGTSVKLMNGEMAGERELLPSAFISLEKIKDTNENLVSVKICGGGYGHGVGMSQNGVKGMLDAGFTYREILAHYFRGTEITVL